jgi:hypothetical protein
MQGMNPYASAFLFDGREVFPARLLYHENENSLIMIQVEHRQGEGEAVAAGLAHLLFQTCFVLSLSHEYFSR